MSKITAKDFEEAIQSASLGWIWDESFNPDCLEQISLTIGECRHIANLLRKSEQKPEMTPIKWSEKTEKRHAL